MGKIDRRKYPELDNLLWDIHNKFVDPKVAFDMYERRWRYVDVQHLTGKERTLVQQLANKFGCGVFMAA
ncbi:hypothetical protein [Shewanella algae]|uniref:hypothetical protein n=1 Tax=Shewanella algae TaxID=38313 RepID=UPI001AAD0F24|nr:hypothetical protein [Shewanella algae]MBO2670012.1 hypothetical protein [Shewanella algae]